MIKSCLWCVEGLQWQELPVVLATGKEMNVAKWMVSQHFTKLYLIYT